MLLFSYLIICESKLLKSFVTVREGTEFFSPNHKCNFSRRAIPCTSSAHGLTWIDMKVCPDWDYTGERIKKMMLFYRLGYNIWLIQTDEPVEFDLSGADEETVNWRTATKSFLYIYQTLIQCSSHTVNIGTAMRLNSGVGLMHNCDGGFMSYVSRYSFKWRLRRNARLTGQLKRFVFSIHPDGFNSS